MAGGVGLEKGGRGTQGGHLGEGGGGGRRMVSQRDRQMQGAGSEGDRVTSRPERGQAGEQEPAGAQKENNREIKRNKKQGRREERCGGWEVGRGVGGGSGPESSTGGRNRAGGLGGRAT